VKEARNSKYVSELHKPVSQVWHVIALLSGAVASPRGLAIVRLHTLVVVLREAVGDLRLVYRGTLFCLVS
jgi:hypothetical protein